MLWCKEFYVSHSRFGLLNLTNLSRRIICPNLIFLFFLEGYFHLYGFTRVEERTTLVDICYKVIHYADHVNSEEKQNIGNDLKKKGNMVNCKLNIG